MFLDKCNAPAFWQLVRFGIVGLLGTGIYLAATILLVSYGGWSVVASATASFLLVIATNYFLHYSWTFRSRRPHSSALLRFIGTSAGGMVINTGFLLASTRVAALRPSILLLGGVCLVVLWNYLLSKLWVFSATGAKR